MMSSWLRASTYAVRCPDIGDSANEYSGCLTGTLLGDDVRVRQAGRQKA